MIELLCPSRGRPKAAAALRESFYATRAIPDSNLIFLLDEDDETQNEYQGGIVIGPPSGNCTAPLNFSALESKADIIGFIGDDSRLTTPGWDIQVTKALQSPAFCWGNDMTGPLAWPSTAFASRPLIQALGYFALPTLQRGFFDVVWFDLARSSGTERVISAQFPHDNSKGWVEPKIIAEDKRAFYHWQETQRESDIRKVKVATALAIF